MSLVVSEVLEYSRHFVLVQYAVGAQVTHTTGHSAGSPYHYCDSFLTLHGESPSLYYCEPHRDSSVVVTMFFIANVDIDTMALTTNSTRYRLDCQ